MSIKEKFKPYSSNVIVFFSCLTMGIIDILLIKYWNSLYGGYVNFQLLWLIIIWVNLLVFGGSWQGEAVKTLLRRLSDVFVANFGFSMVIYSLLSEKQSLILLLFD